MSLLPRAGLLFLFALGFAGSAFAQGRENPATELLNRELPRKKTVSNATRAELLEALCRAVRRNRQAAPGLITAALSLREADPAEMVDTILRCAGKLDCEMAGAIVEAAVAHSPAALKAINDAAVARTPECGENVRAALRATVRNGAEPAANGKKAGAKEEFDPLEPLTLVCVNGTPRAVRESQVAEFLTMYPEAVRGACSPAPVAPRSLPAVAVPPSPSPGR